MKRDVKPLELASLVREFPHIGIDQYLTTLWAMDEDVFFKHYTALTEMNLLAHAATGQQKSAADVSQPDRSGIVRIDISGTMTKQGSSLSSAGSTVRIRNAVRQANNDPNVEAVLFVIDSPGGAVSGTGDLARDMATLSANKPTMTLAEDLMASAGLWVGLQTRKVYANTPNAVIGSMGVFIGLYDLSGMAAQKGIKPIVIKTGELKGAGFPGAEVSQKQLDMWQNLADETLGQFKAAVTANGRKFTEGQMAEILRAGVYSAQQAIGLGLIDGVRSYDDAVSELRSMIPTKKRTGARMDDNVPQAATLGQLRIACMGAGAEFLLRMQDQNATVEQASKAWSEQQNNNIVGLTAKIGELNDQLTAANAKIAELTGQVTTLTSEKATADGKVTSLTADLETARKAAGQRQSFKPLPTGGATSPAPVAVAVANSGLGTGPYAQQMETAIKAKMENGLSRLAATSAVVAENPELQQNYLDEVNKR